MLLPIFACLFTVTSVIACCATPDEVKRHRWFPDQGLLEFGAWSKTGCEGPMIEPYEETWGINDPYKCVLLPERFHKIGSFDFRAESVVVPSLALSKMGLNFGLYGDANCSTELGKTGDTVWIESDFVHKNKKVVAYSIDPSSWDGW
ncbi:hypothetical protein BJ138DRAFT_1101783 [Hygrophoropsis aurantiaca]|uniref:Uncharacterized protein n=1 Tax=Hygrophoropsis aurantiaca TaxID=72124 RepID=A0ACB8ABN9_9AGAM|nr:hypothetical protein BJ138DRAFT_1101783 [Hygrophoropsis aurantiaca]